MTTEQRLLHSMVSDAIAACRIPESRESKFFQALRRANDQVDAVARAQRAEDALIDAQLDRDLFRDQRDELRVRVQELEAEVRELKGEA